MKSADLFGNTQWSHGYLPYEGHYVILSEHTVVTRLSAVWGPLRHLIGTHSGHTVICRMRATTSSYRNTQWSHGYLPCEGHYVILSEHTVVTRLSAVWGPLRHLIGTPSGHTVICRMRATTSSYRNAVVTRLSAVWGPLRHLVFTRSAVRIKSIT
jgi:hypothetical protein